MTHFSFLLCAVAASLLLQVSAQVAVQPPCADPVLCDTGTSYFNEFKLQFAKTVKDLKFSNTYVDLTVTTSGGDSFSYRLVRCGCEAGQVPNGAEVIFVPPRRVYVADTVTLGMIIHDLEARDKVGAVQSTARVYDSAIRSRFKKTTSLAEVKASQDIDLSFLSSFEVTDYVDANVGKPFFLNGETAEATPFGRVEWLKILGLILNKPAIADVKMQRIIRNYNQNKALAALSKRRPSVILNYPFASSSGTSWSQPSEKQYTMQLLRDANADHVFMNDGGNTSNLVTLDEFVQKFRWSRYLIHSGKFPPTRETSMSTLFPESNATDAANITKTLKSLAAVRCANVWVLNKRFVGEGLESANDFFEWGTTNPDLVLRDIITVLHPNINVGRDTVFSSKLDDAAANVKGGDCPYNDLLGKAPDGMVYVDTLMNVEGKNRFELENALVGKIIPEVSKLDNIDSKSVDGFFAKPQEANATSTNFTLRAMVKEGDKDAVLNDTDSMVDAVSRAMGNVTVTSLVAGEPAADPSGAEAILDTPKTSESSSGLSGGAVAGIVIAALALGAIFGGLLYCIGAKRGRTSGETAIRDRFWEEQQVRLADQNTTGGSGAYSVSTAQDRSGVLG